jgi:hypothetical protein
VAFLVSAGASCIAKLGEAAMACWRFSFGSFCEFLGSLELCEFDFL